MNKIENQKLDVQIWRNVPNKKKSFENGVFQNSRRSPHILGGKPQT